MNLEFWARKEGKRASFAAFCGLFARAQLMIEDFSNRTLSIFKGNKLNGFNRQ